MIIAWLLWDYLVFKRGWNNSSVITLGAIESLVYLFLIINGVSYYIFFGGSL